MNLNPDLGAVQSTYQQRYGSDTQLGEAPCTGNVTQFQQKVIVRPYDHVNKLAFRIKSSQTSVVIWDDGLSVRVVHDKCFSAVTHVFGFQCREKE